MSEEQMPLFVPSSTQGMNGRVTLGVQIENLARIFDLDPNQAIAVAGNRIDHVSTKGCGWYAFPSVSALAKKHFPQVTDLDEQYCYAVNMLFQLLDERFHFHTYRKDVICPAFLRRMERTIGALERVQERQSGDIFLLWAQLGGKYNNKSPLHARQHFEDLEFGLGLFEVGSIILSKFTREQQERATFHMYGLGDECSSNQNGLFEHTPSLWNEDGRLDFDPSLTVKEYENFGGVSAFEAVRSSS